MLDDDPVIDYMIMEAVAIKVQKEDSEAQKKTERSDWKDPKKNKEAFDRLRGRG